MQEVVKKNGERYPSRSLYVLVAGLKRYLDKKNRSLVNPLDRSDKQVVNVCIVCSWTPKQIKLL